MARLVSMLALFIAIPSVAHAQGHRLGLQASMGFDARWGVLYAFGLPGDPAGGPEMSHDFVLRAEVGAAFTLVANQSSASIPGGVGWVGLQIGWEGARRLDEIVSLGVTLTAGPSLAILDRGTIRATFFVRPAVCVRYGTFVGSFGIQIDDVLATDDARLDPQGILPSAVISLGLAL